MPRLRSKIAHTDDYGLLPGIKRKGILRDRSYKVPAGVGTPDEFVLESEEKSPRMKKGTKFEVTRVVPGVAQLIEGGTYVIGEIRPDVPAYVISEDVDGKLEKVVVVHAEDFDKYVFGGMSDDDDAEDGEDYDSDFGAEVAGEPVDDMDESYGQRIVFKKKKAKRGVKVSDDVMSSLKEGKPMSRDKYLAMDRVMKVSERMSKLPQDANSKQKRAYKIAKKAIKKAWEAIRKGDTKTAFAQAGVAEKHSYNATYGS